MQSSSTTPALVRLVNQCVTLSRILEPLAKLGVSKGFSTGSKPLKGYLYGIMTTVMLEKMAQEKQMKVTALNDAAVEKHLQENGR